MKNKFYSKLMSLALVFVLVASVAYAQDFNNTVGQGTYTSTVNNNPILRMKASGGLITGIGTTPATKVPGTVVWGTGCTNPFQINPVGGPTGGDFYYTNLQVEGGDATTDTRTFVGDVFIAGNYIHNVAGPDNLGNTDHTTNDVTFTFNGTTGTQTIAGENTTNGTGYNNLVLTGNSNKLITDDAEVTGDFAQDASTNVGGLLTVDGSLTFSSPYGSSIAFNDSLLVGTTGEINMGLSDATFGDLVTNEGTFDGGAGNLLFSGDFYNNPGSSGGNGFTAGSGGVQFTDLYQISGNFTASNADDSISVSGVFDVTDGTINLACTSYFIYNGTSAQFLTTTDVGTWTNGGYGNLIMNGTGLMTADGDVAICNDMWTNREVEMWPTTNEYVLTMLNSATGAEAYYDGDVEVRGSMNWANIESGVAHRFNNTNTTLTFGTAPSAGGFTLTVLPDTEPKTDFDPTQDINRKITGNFTGTGGTIEAISLQWDATDEETGFAFDPLTQDFRFAEGYDTGVRGQTIAIAGNTYGGDGEATPRYITYSGGTGLLSLIARVNPTDSGTTQQFVDDNDFVLTTRPMEVISIVNGRWADPNTWDIGQMPDANHNVAVNHIVWTGDERAQYGGAAYAGNERDGHQSGDLGASANVITILDKDGAALIIGNHDPDMAVNTDGENLFRTRLVSGANLIYNKNTNALGSGADGEGSSATGLNGIWVRQADAFTPALGTYLLNNDGSIVNNSIIEVGVCQ